MNMEWKARIGELVLDASGRKPRLVRLVKAAGFESANYLLVQWSTWFGVRRSEWVSGNYLYPLIERKAMTEAPEQKPTDPKPEPVPAPLPVPDDANPGGNPGSGGH